MDAAKFVAKWRGASLTERSASQQHFLDLCELVGHPKPAEVDTTGESFTFERGASKHGGGEGWADVWKKGFFGWEYKGRHKDLDKAYDQLLRYREALESPPLLVVCDMDRLVVHTNFTNTPAKAYELELDRLAEEPRFLEVLRSVFHAPEKLRPGATSEAITEEAAGRLAAIAQRLRDRGLPAQEVAHFLDRVVFCLFAEDIELLPGMLFSRILEKTRRDPPLFARYVADLFAAMATGGDALLEKIARFNGNLFATTTVLELTAGEIEEIHAASRLDWGAIDPSIFGTLFERGMDPGKRSQLGAHYTSRRDIETLIEPVIFWPLRREWEETRRDVENLLALGTTTPKGGEKPTAEVTEQTARERREKAERQLRDFHQRLATVKILDPACGSGNFLYVALQKLKDLEKEVILYGLEKRFTALIPLVGPWQLHGIEVNPYAYELAQMTVWIGYLQWIRTNGFGVPQEPILRPMDTFELKDAILDLSDPERPREPEWPAVDFIVGNPPFLGGKLLRRELGDQHVDKLFAVWDGRVPREADLVTYWLEKARDQLTKDSAQRVGLLATQAIRGGANREVLRSITANGGIFFAVSDREWVLEGAVVHVSLVGFDSGRERRRILNGVEVGEISPSLSSQVDVAGASRLGENRCLAFMGVTPSGPFVVDDELARRVLDAPNPHGRPNSDVVRPWLNGADINRRAANDWIIDTSDLSRQVAALYERPWTLLEERVLPARSNYRTGGKDFWRHERPRPDMRSAIGPLFRFAARSMVAKHQFWTFVANPTLAANLVIVCAREDEYFLGLLEARIHQVWSGAQGTQLRERESGFRYTPTTCFETFPFPWPPGAEPADDPRVEAIATAARELNALRERWLNPPEWTREEILEFPGAADGPWARYVHDPNAEGIGTVRWPRLVPKDDDAASNLKIRTLTNLYNDRPTWLDNAHRKLDEAVFAAYGWPPDLNDDELLARLLALNLERAAGYVRAKAPTAAGTP